MIAFTMLAESNCRSPSAWQETPVTVSYTVTACCPARPRSAPSMPADSCAASACTRRAPQIPSLTRAPGD